MNNQRNKRVFKQRSQNRKTFYTFHSYGVQHRFAPFEFVTDDRMIVPETGFFESMTRLEFYSREVQMAKQPHVYILDNTGKRVEV